MAERWDYSVEDCRTKLDPSDAEFLSRSEAASVPLNNEKEVRIGWAFSTDKNFAAFEEFFQDYAWATNKDKQHWVEDPEIDSVVLPGKWRHAFTHRIERQDSRGNNEFLIVVTLRRGWAEAISWDEARVRVGHHALSNTEDSGEAYGSDDVTLAVDVEFPNFSPFAALAAATGLPATKTNFTVNSNSLAGTYHKQTVDFQEQEDGSHTLVARYSKPQYTLTGFRDYLLSGQSDIKLCWGVPKDIAQTIIDDFKSKGYSVEPSFSKDQELVNLRIFKPSFVLQMLTNQTATNTCDRFWYSSLYNGVDDPSLYAIPSSATNGVQYDRDIRFDNKGAYDIIVRKGVRQHRTYDWRDSAMSTLEEESLHEQLGVTDQAVVDISAPPRGLLYRQDVNIRDDCSKDYVTRRNQGIYAATDVLKLRETVLEEEFRQLFENDSAQPAMLGAATAGILYTTESTINRFGYYDGQKGARIAKAHEVLGIDSGATKLETEKTDLLDNQESVIEVPSAAAGIIARAESAVNQFGYYDGRRNFAYAQYDRTGLVKAGASVLQESHEDRFVNSDVTPELPTPTAGYVFDATSTLNRFGYYDGAYGYDKAIYGRTGLHKNASGILQESCTDRFVNSSSSPELPAASAGILFEATSTINRYGYYDGAYGYDKAVYGRTGLHKNASTPLSESHADRFVNSTEHPSVPSAPAGLTFDATSTLNRYGYYDGAYGYDVAIYANTGLHKNASEPLVESHTDRFVNSDSHPSLPDAEPGFLFDATSTLNRFGYYDGAYGYSMAAYGNTGLHKDSVSVLLDSSVDRFTNRPTAPVLPSASAGIIFEATATLNRFGYYDGGYGYDKAIYGRTGLIQSASDIRSETHTDRFVNSENAAVAPDAWAGYKFRTANMLNRFGYYDGIYEYETVNPLVAEATFVASQTCLNTGYETIYTERQTPVAAPDDEEGITFSAQNTITGFGYYDGRVRRNDSIERSRVVSTLDSALGYRKASIYNNKRGDLELPSEIQGVMYTAQSTLQPDQTYSGAVNTLLSIEKDTYIPFHTNGIYAGLYAFRNRRAVPTDIISGLGLYNQISPSLRLEDDDTFSGTIVTRGVSGGGGTIAVMDSSKTWTTTKYRKVGVVDEKRTWTFTRHFDFGVSPNNALSSVSGAYGAISLRNAGSGLWLAVWDAASSDTGWITDTDA